MDISKTFVECCCYQLYFSDFKKNASQIIIVRSTLFASIRKKNTVGVNTVRFLKYVRPIFKIMHEKFKFHF